MEAGTDKFAGQDIDQRISNMVRLQKTDDLLFRELLEARAQRDQGKQLLNLEKSMERLKQAAIDQVCIAYGDLAMASGVPWSKARHQMNGPRGHLDRLLDLCKARKIPLLTAICVNQAGVLSGELEEAALKGFVTGAERLGYTVTDAIAFHHQCRDDCWEWGRKLAALPSTDPLAGAS